MRSVPKALSKFKTFINYAIDYAIDTVFVVFKNKVILTTMNTNPLY